MTSNDLQCNDWLTDWHSGYILTTFWLHSGYILTTFWLHCSYILTTLWVQSGYILATFWVHAGYILTIFWLHSDHILTTFWLHSDYILTTFCLHSDYILTTLWLSKTISDWLGGGGITNFWSIVLNDHWSKIIYRPQMIVWSGAIIHPLRWSCCYHFYYYYYSRLTREPIEGAEEILNQCRRWGCLRRGVRTWCWAWVW